MFFDLSFAALVEQLAPRCPTVRHWVAMCDRTHMPTLSAVEPLCYEELVAAEADDYEWPALDENTAATLCYRSEEHTSELQSLMRISYAVFCLKTKISISHYL